MKTRNRLTPAELERLAVLAEECAEVIQIVNKIIRHGYDSYWPEPDDTNRKRLEEELGDLQLAVSLLQSNDDVSLEAIAERAYKKIDKLAKWTYYNDIKSVKP